MTTGNLPAITNPKYQHDESYEERDQFLDWLYFDMYSTESHAGLVARQIHKELLASHVLRNRSSWTWVRHIEKRGWKINGELLMAVWHSWRRHHQ